MTSRFGLATCLVFVSTAAAATSASDSIDSILQRVYDAQQITPSKVCDDATFYRRLSLDLIGRVPTESELRSFLASPNRVAAIEGRLASDEHKRFWSQLWTTMLIGRNARKGIEPELLRLWIEEAFQDDLSLDTIAFELIAAGGVTSLFGPANYPAANRDDPVMSLTRTFLSVQLDCAQCHDHPYDRWTNSDYSSLKQFYRPTRYREVSGGISVSDDAPPQNGPSPVFLTGSKPHTLAWRRELALMVVRSKPFSRSMVNRTWYWLTARGIVDPVDGLSRDNPASVPELLETLATTLSESEFSQQDLIRRICLSKAYQREPAPGDTHENARRREVFAARTIRPLLPEQWIVSAEVVLNRPIPEPSQIAARARSLLGRGSQSLTCDPYHWSATSQTLVRQLSLETPAPIRDLDSLFMTTLAREPDETERNMLADYSSRETLFALLHSSEFAMND